MPSTSVDQGRDYGFADRALALRKRAGLTQRELGALLGVSEKAVGAWEAGLSYPAAERLEPLVALYLGRGVFAAGREEEEAATLWEGVRARAPRRVPPFDPAWFAALPRPDVADVADGSRDASATPAAPPPVEPAPTRGWYDWGEAPAVPLVRGRAAELALLARWTRAGGCRVAQVLGPGGIGKTTLAARLARDLAPEFAVVYWRSLRDAPPAEEWLAGAIAALSAGQAAVPDAFEAQVRGLLELLRERRALLVLDNLETILEPGAPEVRYRAGYEGYGAILGRLAEGAHQGFVLLTSREQPLAADPGDPGDSDDPDDPAGEGAVRALRLGGLGVDAARALLGGDRGLAGDGAAWRALVARYGGNPLALRVVGETIGAVFGGDIAAFLTQETAIFGGVRQLLDEQVGRLSAPEQAILGWLAVEREPVRFAVLVDDLGPRVARAEAVEAVEALRRRSLLEWGAGGAFSLQPVVLEYATTRLVEALADEIAAGAPALLLRLPVLKTTAKDYARRGQERLIARPLLDLLAARYGDAEAVERRLLDLLEGWRGRPAGEQGYGPGNAANLLRLLRGDLRGLDLSRLVLQQAYLQGVEAQDASLAGAHLADAALPDAFSFPTAVALDAGGGFLAAGTATGEVLLWQVADRALLLAVQAHAGPVFSVALSGDGTLVASGGEDGTVTLWDVASSQPLATLRGHAGGVYGVALSADGRLLASGGLDGTMRLWDTMSGRLLASLRGHTGPVSGVALSGDGHTAASGGQDGTVRLWEAASGRLAATVQATPVGRGSGLLKVALSRDGTLVASGGEDGTVTLWDVASSQPLATLRGHAGGVYGVALSADGRLLASGSYDGTVRLWDTVSSQPLATLRGHGSGVQGVALSGDSTLAASAGLDGTVQLWDVASGRPLATLQGYSGGILDVALTGDGRLVASGDQAGAARLWDAASKQPLAAMQGHVGAVLGVALSADGRLLVSGGHDGTVRLWDAASGRSSITLQGQGQEHGSGVYGVATSGDGALVASGSEDGAIRLWDAATGRPVATLRGHAGLVYGVALSGDGALAASAGQDGTVRLWEAGSWRLLAAPQGHAGPVLGVALSGDGWFVASGGIDGTVRLWGVPDGRALETLRGHASGVASVALSGDGALVASGGFDGTVRLWDVRNGRALATLEGHAGLVQAVALSEDGQLLASGGFDGTVRLWDTTSGALLRTLRPDRPYERMDITGLTGVTEAQRAALRALGAVERAPSPSTLHPTIQTAEPESPAAVPVTAPPALATAPDPTPTPELASARPPDRPPTNLPSDRSSFVGRAADLVALSGALDPAAGDGVRLLTLSGVAGSGKTRLALAVAEMVRGKYGDGAWLVELASLPTDPSPDPTAVADAALSALGLREQPGQEAPDTLVGRLRERRLLLVLDNCEHLVAACAALAARLLEACPEVCILATSQRPLRLPAETVWPVAPLALPDLAEGAPTLETLRALGQADAVRLFVERARAARPGFALDAANAVAVVEICRALDGLPLAIELAAARLHVLSVNDLLARLDDRFRLLGRGGRGVADRRQTLQATMDWSYALLSPVEQALLRRCAVFAGGWELAAAEAVCAAGEVAEEAVLGLLDELLDRSLVYIYDAGGEPRYGLLETVRQYGAQQLERAGEVAGVRDRRLAWCATLAERAAAALQGPEQASWLARLEREGDNLRAALQWALDRGLSTLGLRVAGGLGKFWLRAGHQREGRRWLAAVLALTPDGNDAVTLSARATALEAAAGLAEDAHDFTGATALFAQSEALRRTLGQDEHLAAGLLNAGMEARARGDYARATALLEESLAQYRRPENRERGPRDTLGPLITFAYRYTCLALVLTEQGDYARAAALCEECLRLAREAGDAEGSGIALLSLADVARDQGDAGRVRAYAGESLGLFRGLGHPRAIGFALNNLALAAYLDGDLALAASQVEEAVALFQDMQAGPSLAEALVTRGRVRGTRGAGEAARADLAEALTLAVPMGPRVVVAAALAALGVLAVGQGQARQGVLLLGAAARMREAMGTPARPADRPAVEGARATARATLGDAPCAEAWAAGQALPVERLVAQVTASLGDDTNR